ncbi:MAG: DUF3300 domain-containing protein [Burkholderiaceae bacterium]|nr:DUF3300 domain-containing protein [Burkholderiaceae bacterium]
MKKRFFGVRYDLFCVLTFAVLCSSACADLPPSESQTELQSTSQAAYTTAELDQILAPIALYPDALLLQILMASGYQKDVVEAGRWVDAYPDASGEELAKAAGSFTWDSSVKALLPFPDVLLTMSSNMEWTVKLGNAFNEQREEVMDRVQHLREKAQESGSLQSNEYMNVVNDDGRVVIEPSSSGTTYVPYYNPTVVYGSWGWPQEPYYWAPPGGYAYSSGGFMWGNGIVFSYTRFPGHFDWHRRAVIHRPPPHRVHGMRPPPHRGDRRPPPHRGDRNPPPRRDDRRPPPHQGDRRPPHGVRGPQAGDRRPSPGTRGPQASAHSLSPGSRSARPAAGREQPAARRQSSRPASGTSRNSPRATQTGQRPAQRHTSRTQSGARPSASRSSASRPPARSGGTRSNSGTRSHSKNEQKK